MSSSAIEIKMTDWTNPLMKKVVLFFDPKRAMVSPKERLAAHGWKNETVVSIIMSMDTSRNMIKVLSMLSREGLLITQQASYTCIKLIYLLSILMPLKHKLFGFENVTLFLGVAGSRNCQVLFRQNQAYRRFVHV